VSEWTEYRSAEGGFVVSHPSGWRSAEGIMGAAVVLVAGEPGTGGFAANVSVTAQELPDAVDPDEFGRSQLAAMAELLTDVRLVDRSEAHLLGWPGERVLVTYRQGIHSLALEQWWAIADAGPGAVVVSATCPVLDYDDYADDFGRVAASLRVDG
jgi:hypothetical protein